MDGAVPLIDVDVDSVIEIAIRFGSVGILVALHLDAGATHGVGNLLPLGGTVLSITTSPVTTASSDHGFAAYGHPNCALERLTRSPGPVAQRHPGSTHLALQVHWHG
jgi:hypothetical protein